MANPTGKIPIPPPKKNLNGRDEVVWFNGSIRKGPKRLPLERLWFGLLANFGPQTMEVTNESPSGLRKCE